jgi:hypothetical protein
MLKQGTAFGYGATDIFNIKVGPAEKEWDSEGDMDKGEHPQMDPEVEEDNAPFISNEQPEYSQPINYPMYMSPYSPPFDQTQDAYQIPAPFQMLGSAYTDSPVYAGTPCGQINLSPQQAVFPFNTYPIDSTPAQSAPMSPQDYGRSPPTYYASAMEQSASNLSTNESFAVNTSPPEVSEIPANYPSFDGYRVNYNQNATQNESQQTDSGYSNALASQDSYNTYDSGTNEMFHQSFHGTSQQSVGNPSTSDSRMFMPSQYPVNNQAALEGTPSLRTLFCRSLTLRRVP